jgi:hypothetical protein
MKAERRHELQENSLAKGIQNFPQFWKDYGSKISLVIILFLLALVLVRYWLNSRDVARQTVAMELTSARTLFEQYRSGNIPLALLGEEAMAQPMMSMFARQTDGTVPMMFVGDDADGRIRNRVRDRVEAAVAEALKSSSDPARQAEATLLRADLNLHLGGDSPFYPADHQGVRQDPAAVFRDRREGLRRTDRAGRQDPGVHGGVGSLRHGGASREPRRPGQGPRDLRPAQEGRP